VKCEKQPYFSSIFMIQFYTFKKHKEILFSRTICSLAFWAKFELTSCLMVSCEFNFHMLFLNVHTFTAVEVGGKKINFNAKFHTVPARFI